MRESYTDGGRVVSRRERQTRWWLSGTAAVIVYACVFLFVPQLSPNPAVRAWPLQKVSAALYGIVHDERRQVYPPQRYAQARWIEWIEQQMPLRYLWPWGPALFAALAGLGVWIALNPDEQRVLVQRGARQQSASDLAAALKRRSEQQKRQH